MVLFIIMYIHLNACAWWMFIKSDKKWIPLYYIETGENYYAIYDLPIWSAYLYCVFTSVQGLLGGDNFPQGISQITMCIISVIMGAIINANIFSELAVIFQSIG